MDTRKNFYSSAVIKMVTNLSVTITQNPLWNQKFGRGIAALLKAIAPTIAPITM